MTTSANASRPWYLTSVAILLIVIGIGFFLAFGGNAIYVLTEKPPFTFHVAVIFSLLGLWALLIVAATGLLLGKQWSRLVLIAGLVGLGIITTPSAPLFHNIGKLVIYGLLIYAIFTRQSNAYFLAKKSVKAAS